MLFCVFRGPGGRAASADDEDPAAVETDGMGMMDLPNGQSNVATFAATASEVSLRHCIAVVFVLDVDVSTSQCIYMPTIYHSYSTLDILT